MASAPIDIYRRQILRELQAGNATEHTHRPALKALIETLATGVTATNEPKRVECGAPDYVISRKPPHGRVTLGYVEAKDVGKPLDEVERSDQMKRYLPALSNLILTDYLEFRWYVGGDYRQTARLARVSKGHKLTLEKDGAEVVTDLLTEFLSHEAELINDPKTLALRMARLTHFIRDMIATAFESNSASGTLTDLRGAFEKALIPDLRTSQFADMFAQTLAYGLFAARCNHHGPKGSFKRLGAASEIPKTNPFLRQLFETITGTALDDEPYAGFVDDLAQLLAATDIDAVLADFGKRTARQDPVVHFYETFLAAYDPKLRERRGVYYTPEPVVSYLVRSVDYLLKTRFGCANGLADTATVEYEREEESAGKVKKVKAISPRVLILDPACGTGTFLYTVIDHIRQEFMRQGNAGMWSGYVRNHLLPRIFGFELLMAPYAVAHFKLGMQLAGHDLTPAQREKWAYDFTGNERLGVYLTNTLEEAEQKAETLFGPLRVISQEANAALKIKSELPILAIMGNPPYSGSSANRSHDKEGNLTFIGRLIQDYRTAEGQPLAERNPKMLQDDYVKFIRFAQSRIDRTGYGILAFITNHSYLDNPTFRGMRESLMHSFSEIFLCDLHGNARKGEKAPDGGHDGNVFDIQQGVAVIVAVKQDNANGRCRVYHTELWGRREDKYSWLWEANISRVPWRPLTPEPPSYLFTPQDRTTFWEYDRSWKLTDAMPLSSSCMNTARDAFVIDIDSENLSRRIGGAFSSDLDPAQLAESLGLEDTGWWKFSEALSTLRETPAWQNLIIKCLYRPFDSRWIFHHPAFVDRPRTKLNSHMLQGNLSLVTTRQTKEPFAVLATNLVCGQHKIAAVYDRSYFFPLYIYRDGAQRLITMGKVREANFCSAFTADIEKRMGLSFVPDGKGDLQQTFGPEDIFNYIYAVFYSPTYRARYAEFLKTDFPRVPLTSDVNLFRSLCEFGGELVALHLLESPVLQNPIARYPVKGSNIVEKGFPQYVIPACSVEQPSPPLEECRVYINGKFGSKEAQYFECVPLEVWDFHIGGYQVCEKWLKDRRGRTLTYDDQKHYCKVVTAIKETIRHMAEIDAAIPKWPLE